MEYGEHPETNVMLHMFFVRGGVVLGGMDSVQLGSKGTTDVPQPKTEDCQYRCNRKTNWNHCFFSLDSLHYTTQGRYHNLLQLIYQKTKELGLTVIHCNNRCFEIAELRHRQPSSGDDK